MSQANKTSIILTKLGKMSALEIHDGINMRLSVAQAALDFADQYGSLMNTGFEPCIEDVYPDHIGHSALAQHLMAEVAVFVNQLRSVERAKG